MGGWRGNGESRIKITVKLNCLFKWNPVSGTEDVMYLIVMAKHYVVHGQQIAENSIT